MVNPTDGNDDERVFKGESKARGIARKHNQEIYKGFLLEKERG